VFVELDPKLGRAHPPPPDSGAMRRLDGIGVASDPVGRETVRLRTVTPPETTASTGIASPRATAVSVGPRHIEPLRRPDAFED
jgi:hypothetical protein